MRRRVVARQPESWRAVPRRDTDVIPSGRFNQTRRSVQMNLARARYRRSARPVRQPLGVRHRPAALALAAGSAGTGPADAGGGIGGPVVARAVVRLGVLV